MQLYPQNLLSLRTWFGVVFSPMAILIGLIMIGVPAVLIVWTYFPLMGVFLWLFLTHQMACRRCGRALSTTRINGEQLVCRHCHTPTDKALREAARVR